MQYPVALARLVRRPAFLASAIASLLAAGAGAGILSTQAPLTPRAEMAVREEVSGECPAGAHDPQLASQQETLPPAPTKAEGEAQVALENAEFRNSEGCLECHEGVEPSHPNPLESKTTCVGCHGGNGKATTKSAAHVEPRFPARWGKNRKDAASGNPEQTYTLLNRESPEFIRFMNPGDLRVAHLSCGAQDGQGCHGGSGAEDDMILHVRKSMMASGGMLWNAALYNNGAFPLKNARFGESYSEEGVPQRLQGTFKDPAGKWRLPTPEETLQRGMLTFLDPLPRWEITQVGNVLRVFEAGGLRKGEVGQPERGEEPGRPDAKLSVRGHGTLLRTDPVYLGLQKTRLFDPSLNFLGTNDQPGDFHSSGCTTCHSVYANDRTERISGPYAKFGHWGESFTKDKALQPAVRSKERGHPISHRMVRAMPTSQCMSCHIHPGGNMLATFMGQIWWDNETDGEHLYPEKPLKLSPQERDAVQRRNPEGAALKGEWSNVDFLAKTADLNPKLKHVQLGDFHSHGWILRNVYKQDRKGNMLDAEGKVVPHGDPEKWKKAVHLQDIHLEKGMHCADCHFRKDAHGDAALYQEARAAIEVDCADCHGTIQKRADPTAADAKPTGFAARNPTGLAAEATLFDYNAVRWGGELQDRWYKKEDGRLFQRSAVEEGKEWEVPQVLDTITPGHPRYNERSRLAKTMRRNGTTWGSVPAPGAEDELAHSTTKMACYTCHTSWTSSCFGCHLSMEANQKKPNLHNEGNQSRNWTSYNFQTLRDDAFMLGKDGTVTGNRIVPVRSSCAVLVSSRNQNREWIYSQQQTVSAEGFAGTAFSTFVPHTVRGKETKFCTDCHQSRQNDNNAWMANLLLHGTNYYNFMGIYCWAATGKGFLGIPVTEREEPQAVIGSHLHQLAYPNEYARHVRGGRILRGSARYHHGHTLQIQQRGEYLYAAEGPKGVVIYDIANAHNKGFSERVVTAPVSPLGQQFSLKTKYATAIAAPSTMAIDPARTRRAENQEGKIHPLYGYLYVADRAEGLILVGAATLLDGDPTNNFLKRALTWNPDGVLDGANSIQIAGKYAYVTCDQGLVVVDLDNPLQPKVAGLLGKPALREPTSVAVQLRYAFVCDADGLKVVKIEQPEAPELIADARMPLKGARDVYVARTYAYVAAGAEGVAIVDVENPEKPELDQLFDAEGEIDDAHMVRLAMTNNSLFAYVADGHNGLRVLQLTSPNDTPGYFGFSPRPTPELIATYRTDHPVLAITEALDRDRAVDESGNQLAVFGRRGARPLNFDEQLTMLLTEVANQPPGPPEDLQPMPAKAALGWGELLFAFPLLGLVLRRRVSAADCAGT